MDESPQPQNEAPPAPLNTPPPLLSAASPPPPPPPPPLTSAATPQPPRRSGRGWMIFALLLCVLLAFSMLLNLNQFFTGLFSVSTVRYPYQAGPRVEEVLVEDNDSPDKIAVVEVQGIITSDMLDRGGVGMVELIRVQLKRAYRDPRVKAVILKVDSPGGEVLASDEISREIEEFQKKSGKPVIASLGSVAASGGYYVCAQSRWIVANELTLTGSIGVILSSWNYRGLMNKVGVRPEVYKSGRFKDMLSGSRDPELTTQQERDMLQAMVDQTFARFKQVVRSGREAAHEKNKSLGKALADDWMDYADGRVLTGSEAYKSGFVDELGNFETAAKRARELAGIASADLIRYQQRHDLSQLFRFFGNTDANTVKLDLGMELPKLNAGELYFLSPALIR